MTDQSIGKIGQITQAATFAAGQTLMSQGDPGDSFIVIISGTAAVSQGGRPLRDLGPGDFLGEVSLIDGGPRTATVSATTDIEALVVDREGFGRLMTEFPVVRLDLVTALTHRLRERAPALTD